LRFYYKALLISVFFCLTQLVNAQNFSLAEKELNRKADKLFRRDSFAAALPLYSQLLSIHPKEPVLSYKFGICVLMADRRNTEMPVKYLEFASDKQNVDEDVYYYLGYAYQLNYRFTEAINQFKKFNSKASNSKLKKYDTDSRIEMCNNGKKLLNNISDLYVLEKKVVSKHDFFRSYNFTEFGGNFLAKPEQFKTNLDKKLNDNSFVFYSEKNRVIYFSSYGEGKERKANRDLYRSFQNSYGEWSEPERLSNVINTQYDEDYPFILPDGKTLYFCSKGHNSMGGFDIFKSVFENRTKTWSNPENLDFAINTPFDDILFVSDSLQQYAYFSSTRNTSEGMLCVYKVRIDRRLKPQILAEVKKENSELAYTQKDSTYLNFIKSKANLEVNATEDMFASIPESISHSPQLQTKDKSKIFINKGQDSEAIGQIFETKSPETNKNSDYTSEIEKNPKELADADENKYISNEKAAKKIAEDKKIAARKLRAKADSIIMNADKVEGVSRKNYIKEKAEVLKENAEKLERESKFAEDLSRQYEEAFKYNHKKVVTGEENLISTKNVKQKDKSISAISHLNEKTKEINIEPYIIPNIRAEEEYISKSKAQIKNIDIERTKIKNDISDLKKKSDDYKQQSNLTKDKEVKKIYISESKSRDSIISVKQKEDKQLAEESEYFLQKTDSVKAEIVMRNDIYAQVSTLVSNQQSTVNNQQNQTTDYVQQSDKKSQKTKIQIQNVTDNSQQTQISEITKQSVVPDRKITINKEQTLNNEVTENIKGEKGINKKGEKNKTGELHESILNNEKEKIKNEIIKKNEKLDKDIIVLDQYAETSLKTAIKKNSQANKKEKEADSIEIHADKIKDNQIKIKELDKSKELKEEVSELKDESLAAFKVSENFRTEIHKKKVLKEDMTIKLKEVEESRDISELKKKNDAFKPQIIEAEKINNPKEIIVKEDIKKGIEKEKEAKAYSDKAEKSKGEVNKLNFKIDSLQKRAKNEKNTIRMTKLLKQVNALQDEANQKENEVYNNNTRARNLQAEAQNIKIIAKFQDTLIAQLQNNSINNDNIKTDKIQRDELSSELAAYEKQNFTKQTIIENKDEAIETKQPEKVTEIKVEAESVQLTYNKANSIQYNIQKFQKNSDSLLKAYETKSKDAIRKGEESRKAVNKANIKRKEINKNSAIAIANELKKDSTRLSDQAVVDKNISAILKNKANAQKKLLDPVIPEIKQLKESASIQNSTKMKNKFREVIQKLNNKAFDNQNLDRDISNEISLIALNKIKKSKTISNDTKRIQGSIDKTLKETDRLKNEITTAPGESIKKDLQKKYLSKQKAIDSLKKILSEKNKQAKELKAETSALKSQVDYTEDITKNITGSQKSVISNTEIVKNIEPTTITDNRISNNEQISEAKSENKETPQKSENVKLSSNQNKKLAVNKSMDSIAEDQIHEYHKNIDDNKNKYNRLRNESALVKSKIDLSQVKDTVVKVYEYEAEYYFRKAIIFKNKSDSAANKKMKTSLLKDANNYELIAIDKQEKAIDIYKQADSQQSIVNSKSLSINNQQPSLTNKQDINKNINTIKPEEIKGSEQKNINAETKTNAEIIKKTNVKTDSVIKQNTNQGKKNISTEPQTKIEIAEKTTKKSDTIKTQVLKDKQSNLNKINFSQNNIVKEKNIKSDSINKPILKPEKQTVNLEPQTKSQITLKKPVRNNTIKMPGKSRDQKNDSAKNKPVKEKAKMDVEIVKNIKSEPLSITSIGKPEIIKKEANKEINIPVNPLVPKPEPMAGEKIESVKGLFYTVQIGVYSKPRTDQQFINMKPLYYEQMSNGNYRYMSGVYNKKEDAVTAKDAISQKGIKDAFVVIYKDGKKLSLADVLKLPKDTINKYKNTTNLINGEEKIPEKDVIFFEVQIGAFKRPANILKSNKFLRISNTKIGIIKTEKGMLLYTAGDFKDFNSAVELKRNIVKSGIHDAFVIAVKNNKKISVIQARNLLKNIKN
jgi:epidermal growth factor receptor substrate 15